MRMSRHYASNSLQTQNQWHRHPQRTNFSEYAEEIAIVFSSYQVLIKLFGYLIIGYLIIFAINYFLRLIILIAYLC